MNRNLANNNKIRFIFFVTSILIVLVTLLSVERILIPLGLSYILAVILKPILKVLTTGPYLRRAILSFIIFITIFGVTMTFGQALNSISDEITKLEVYIPKLEIYLRAKYDIFKGWVFTKFNYSIELNPVDKIIELGQKTSRTILIYLPKILGSILEWGFIIPLFLFFILRDGRKLTKEVLKIVPNNIVEKVYLLIFRFNKKFGDYIFAKTIEALIVGVIITIGLLIIGYPFALILGIVAAVTNILPYLGPILGFVPALVIGFSGGYDDTMVFAMIVLYAIANIIDLAFVFPILVSKIVNLHPIIVVISVIVGSQFLGVVGMIISIPIAAFLKILYEQIYSELYERGISL
ncbi:MAG: AI-2E family transporter [Bacteriovoracaceae bacterium]|jgi:putative permease|nr:AI-2E family transporter [Bacteriovoracaceae bacterium]